MSPRFSCHMCSISQARDAVASSSNPMKTGGRVLAKNAAGCWQIHPGHVNPVVSYRGRSVRGTRLQPCT